MSMKVMTDGRLHYDPSGLLGSPSPINMVVGGRTTGKTFAFNYQAIKNYINTGAHFAIITRYETQMQHIMQHPFLQPVTDAGYFKGWEVSAKGSKFYIRRTKKGAKWEEFGDCLALTKYEDYKRTAFPDTTMMVYDEFIKATPLPPYLRNEPDLLMNVWSSITRRSDRCRVYMLANNVSLSNPYFSAWNVRLPKPGRTITIPHGRSSITVENLFSADFIADSADDIVSKFTAGSAYEQMALFNDFEHATNYVKKPSNAMYRFSFTVAGKSVGLWMDTKGNWYCTNKLPKNKAAYPQFVIVKADWRPDMVIIKRSHGILKALEKVVRGGFMYFEDATAEYNFESIYPLMGITS